MEKPLISDRVKIDFHAGVADVRLNRADKMNALDPAMMKGLIEDIMPWIYAVLIMVVVILILSTAIGIQP